MIDYVEIQARKKAHDLVLMIFKDKTLNIGKGKVVSKLKDAASNVPAELFEAHARFSDKEKLKYIVKARGFLQETRYYFELLKDLNRISLKPKNKYLSKIDLLDRLFIIMIKNCKEEKLRNTNINYFYKLRRV